MISVEKFVFNDFQENTYVLHDESGEGLIIDPGCNNEAERASLVSFISGEGIRPLKIINTHGHIDHVLGVRYLASHFSIPFIIHRFDLPLVERSVEQAVMFSLDFSEAPVADGYLEDNEEISLGSSGLKVIHLPGHSPGGIGLYCQAQNFVLAGDVLFSGSIGRTDLPGGDYDTLIASIKNKLFTLDDNCLVYSGHGPETSIGKERRTNPYLS
jgi:hydroxyacylglutathione hydrolase